MTILNPATSIYGVTTGRGLNSGGTALEGNGSLSMDNLMRGMAHMSEEGFTPNILLMHPLFYYSFYSRSCTSQHDASSWWWFYL